VWQRRPHAVIHHSDQGNRNPSLAFGARCREAAVRPSMGSVGDCLDNAMCEASLPPATTSSLEELDGSAHRSAAEGTASGAVPGGAAFDSEPITLFGSSSMPGEGRGQMADIEITASRKTLDGN